MSAKLFILDADYLYAAIEMRDPPGVRDVSLANGGGVTIKRGCEVRRTMLCSALGFFQPCQRLALSVCIRHWSLSVVRWRNISLLCVKRMPFLASILTLSS